MYTWSISLLLITLATADDLNNQVTDGLHMLGWLVQMGAVQSFETIEASDSWLTISAVSTMSKENFDMYIEEYLHFYPQVWKV